MVNARLSYSNVVATLALFLAISGGIAWALDRNSVESKHIANRTIRATDVKPETLTGDQIREPTLKQPDAGEWVPIEAASGDCTGFTLRFCGSWSNVGSTYATTAIYKDPRTKIVRLRGVVACPGGCENETIFHLPAGMAPVESEVFASVSSDGHPDDRLARIDANSSSDPSFPEQVRMIVGPTIDFVTLSGIEWPSDLDP